MERFAVGICMIDDGKEELTSGAYGVYSRVEGIQLCEVEMDDGDDGDDDADAGLSSLPRNFLPLSATLDRYLEDFFGFPPIGKVMRMTTD